MVGSGKGSFEMRGRQLGAALGARVCTAPSESDLRWADVVVLIKRAGLAWCDYVHTFDKPIVWDALDFWEQPSQNGLSEMDARALLQRTIAKIRPTLTIGATQAMADACGGVYLPHHSWEGLTPTLPRAEVTTVGYQGKKMYLGRWFQTVNDECERRGWTFVANPADLRTCDLLVAFRDGQWDGWMCREWKSGVKIINAIAAGRPIITQPSAAFSELPYCGSSVEDLSERLTVALSLWDYADDRAALAVQSRAAEFTLQSVASRYRQILQAVARSKAA